MSNYAAAYSMSQGLFLADDRKGRIQTRFKLHWIDLVDPGCFWPQPYSLEQSLLALRFLARSAKPFTKYNRNGPLDLLSLKPTCIGSSTIDPIVSLDDLRRRFEYAILWHARSASYAEWRHLARVGVNETRWIDGKHYEPFKPSPKLFACEADFRKAFESLLATSDAKLNYSPNSYHKQAIWMHHVYLEVCAAGFRVQANYGYRREAASWCVTLAQTENAEPPMETIARAIAKLTAVTTGVKA